MKTIIKNLIQIVKILVMEMMGLNQAVQVKHMTKTLVVDIMELNRTVQLENKFEILMKEINKDEMMQRLLLSKRLGKRLGNFLILLKDLQINRFLDNLTIKIGKTTQPMVIKEANVFVYSIVILS